LRALVTVTDSSQQDANIPYKGGAEKFMIIDPNKPSNDISGGSTNSTTIRKAFSSAFSELSKRMGQIATSPQESRPNQSLLQCILGGNYTSFELQREHLAHVHEKLFGPVKQ
jgi:non-canonical poly(A) RNA polymerase PAPD5/7